MEDIIRSAVEEHIEQARRFLFQDVATLSEVARKLTECLKAGGKILWCGNGGSAADAQHLAAELMGRFKRERAPLPAIALTTDTSLLTAVGNDYGYQHVFSRQVRGLMTAKDVLVGLSTSGNSPNVVEAIAAAKAIGGFTVGFLGNEGGKLKAECDISLVVPHADTARIQEIHIMAGHILCDLIEREFA